MKKIDAEIAVLKERLAKTRALNRRMVEHDIAAVRAEVEDALAIAHLFDALKKRAKTKAETLSLPQLCKLLGDGWSYAQYRRRIQVGKNLDKYVERRREAGDSGRYGLSYAEELITDDHASNSCPREIDAKSSPASTPKAIASQTNSQRREPVARSTPPASSGYIITRRQRWDELYAEWPDAVDLFPHPFSGEDAFSRKSWPPTVFANFMFRKSADPFGRSPLDNVRLLIQRNQTEGTEIIIPFPSSDPINALLDAGAEARSWGREPWLHAETGEYCPNPGAVSLFILRGHSR